MTRPQFPSNIREQPKSVAVTNGTGSVLTLNYKYCPGGLSSCSSNNGNVVSAAIVTPSLNLAQNFVYDLANRLTCANEMSSARRGDGVPPVSVQHRTRNT